MRTRVARAGGVSARAIGLALMVSVSFASMEAAMAQEAQTSATSERSFSVPAGPLSGALVAFGQQAGIQVSYVPSVAEGLSSPGVSGAMSADAALSQLLSGTGLTFELTGTTAVISNTADAGATIEGAIALDTINVSGATSGAAAADLPFETPGSISYISADQIARFPGKTAGDIFRGTPGVISGMNRNGAAIDVNIRGMQGMGRVAVTIDGSQQSTSTYRGYNGVDNRSYVDPDLISGATITKGPDGGAAGAIGGTVAIDTLKVEDILKPGDAYGVRVKGELSGNSIAPQIDSTSPRSDDDEGLFGAKSGSIAFASSGENVDLVGAYVRRKSGNYFAGNNGPLTSTDIYGAQEPLSAFKYGEEVFNTSEDSTSYLLKGTMRLSEDQKLQLGYLRYENTFGEVMPTVVVNTSANPRQVALSSVTIDQLTANYGWNPADNDLIDLKANAWMSNTDEDSVNTVYIYDDYRYTQTKNYGFNISNTSRFDLASLPVTLSYGGKATLEDATQRLRREERTAIIAPPRGTREIGELFFNGKVEPTKWLALDAGINYLAYRTHNRGATRYDNYDARGYPPYEDYTGDGFSPSAGITITPVEGWQLFGRYTTGIRPPSLRESTYTLSALVFNPDLQAEKAKNWEVGTNILMSDVLMTGDVARLKLAYFDNTTDDYIGREWDGTGQTLSLFNYDKIVMKGIELSGGYDAKPGFVDFALNYYTDFEACAPGTACVNYTSQADYLTNQIPPEFSASVTGALRFLDGDLTLGGRYTYMGERLAPLVAGTGYFDFITVQWAPYQVVDTFAQWKVNDSVTVDASIENLLDRYYADALNNTDLPAPGRTFRVSLTAKTGGTEPLPDLWPSFDFAGGMTEADGTVSVPRWTGLYAGAHVGHGYGSVTGQTTAADGTSDSIAASESADQRLQNLLYGGQIGFNYQTASNWVFGIEGDFARTKLHDSAEIRSTEGPDLITNKQLEARIDYQSDWLATLRGRVGYAFDNWLIYATGGAAFMKETEHRTQYTSNGYSGNPTGNRTSYLFDESASEVRTGWTVGGGVEYALSSNWSIKGEYLYSGFGDKNFRFPGARSGVAQGYTERVQDGCVPLPIPVCIPNWVNIDHPGSSDITNGRKASNRFDLHSLKLGVNYRF